MEKKHKFYLIFMGPPGSGKGTQADMLSEKISLPVISPGELLRHERDQGTKLGQKVKETMKNGNLVPDEIIEKLIEKRWEKKDARAGIIFDGYPRNEKQLEKLIKKLNKKTNPDDIIRAIFIDVEDNKVIERIGGRRVCDCGLAYHLKYNPPKKKGVCDECGRELYTRKDDKPAVIKNRLRLYHRLIKPLLDYWKEQGELITINGHQNIEKVQKDIMARIKRL